METKTKAETSGNGTGLLSGLRLAGHRHIRLTRGIAIASVAVVLLAGLVYFLAARRTPAVSYVTAEVTRGPLTVTVTATGQLAPVTEVDIGSEVSGTIQSVEVDYNSHVRAGQVLARINTDKLKAGAEQARSALASSQAKTREADATVKESQLAVWRCSQLRAKNLCSQETLDEANAALDRATADRAMAIAEVARAQATLSAAETDLSKAVIRSPIDGIVLTRSAEPGQTVAASFQSPVLFTLARDLTHMELDVDVDEADIGQVRDGQTATFTVDAYPNRKFPAVISQVRFGPRTIQGVVTYQTVLMVDNSELLLRPGMTATAMIVVKQIADAVLLPNTALRFQPPTAAVDENRGLMGSLLPHPPRSLLQQSRAPVETSEREVWTLQGGKLVPLKITTGATDGTQTQILGGDLKQGMQVVTDTATQSS